MKQYLLLWWIVVIGSILPFFGQGQVINFTLDKSDLIQKLTHVQRYDSLGYAYIRLASYELAENINNCIYYHEKADSLATANNDLYLKNYNGMLASIAYTNLTKFTEALSLTNEAITYFQSIKDTTNLLKAYMYRGFANSTSSNYERGMSDYQTAADLSKKIGLHIEKHNAYNRMGILLKSLDRKEEANTLYKKIIEDNENGIKGGYYSAATHNLGVNYLEMDSLPLAEQYLNKSLDIRRQGINFSNNSKSTIYAALSDLYHKKKEYTAAAKYRDSCIYYDDITRIVYNRISNRVKRAEIGIKLGDKSHVTRLLSEAQLLITENADSYQYLQYDIYKQYAILYKNQGNYRIANSFLEKAHHLKDSLDRQKYKSNIATLEQVNKMQVVENENIKLGAQNLEQKLTISRQRYRYNILIGLGLVLLTLSFMAFLFSKNKMHQNKLLAERNNIIEDNLKEKELLLKEIHHRVKNNLQIISSILNMQARYIKDDKALIAVKESRNRVKTMALVHQKMYQNENMNGVFAHEYISSLIESLFYNYKDTHPSIVSELQLEPNLFLDSDLLSNIGLIINELITNSFKYAFEGRDTGQISVHLKKEEEELVLKVIDDGIGFDASHVSNVSVGFGFELVDMLVDKLKGQIVRESSNLGSIITIYIPHI